MLDLKSEVVLWIKRSELPQTSKIFFKHFLDENNNIFPQESTYWDYKREFPHSRSDDYFGGILALICAFHNTYGGIVVFGVHNELRTIGHNKVKINIENLNKLLTERLSTPIECIHTKYTIDVDEDKTDSEKVASQAVDVILVPKREISISPVRFSQAIGKKYDANIIYKRQNHETLKVTSDDLSLVYGSRESYGLESDLESYNDNSIEAELPPSPSTMRDFIGRVSVLDKLWDWLTSSDEPRTFLAGKGGSGKSTIAHEFARIISQEGRQLKLFDGKSIDWVIFVSAKKRQLNPVNLEIEEFLGSDFNNSTELFQKILIFADWQTDIEKIKQYDDDELEIQLRELFDTLTLLLVIDDIDTLTTANLDPGMDLLYKLMVRAKQGGKILYTLREPPKHSLTNSIEVMGLDQKAEYPEFVSKCCKQFEVPEPSEKLLNDQLNTVSERRPLVLESIIGLRRTADNYDRALQIFRERGGDGVRSYLFEREYTALPTNDRARLLLAALSIFKKPTSFTDLEAVLNFQIEVLNDAIGAVNQMFLTHTVDPSTTETLYSLSNITRSYIATQSLNLNFYQTLFDTIKAFNSDLQRENPEFARLKSRAEHHLKYKEFQHAIDVLASSRNKTTITQLPGYQGLLGQAYAQLDEPNINKAREAFNYVGRMNTTDPVSMRVWFYMEKNNGHGLKEALAICDIVIRGKNYSQFYKTEFFCKKGMVLSLMAKNSLRSDPDDAIKEYKQGMYSYFQAFNIGIQEREIDTEKSEAGLASTVGYFLDSLNLLGKQNELFGFLKEISEGNIYYIDPMVEPLKAYLPALARSHNADHLNRYSGLIDRTIKLVSSKKLIKFIDETLRSTLINAFITAQDTIDSKRRTLNK